MSLHVGKAFGTFQFPNYGMFVMKLLDAFHFGDMHIEGCLQLTVHVHVYLKLHAQI